MTTAAGGFEATLGGIALRMTRALEVSGVLDEITRGLVRDLDAALARIWLLEAGPKRKTDAGDGELVLAASAGLSERLDGSRSRIASGALKIGEIAATRAAIATGDLASDPRFADKEWIATNGLTSFAGYPLVYGERLLGVLAMFSRRPLEPAEIDRLGIFAAQASVAIENARLFDEVRTLSRRLEAENRYLKEELEVGRPRAIVGESAAIRRALGEVQRVAPTPSSVLLLGETGTGKELFAQAIHEASPRAKAPLVKVNCAALVPSLVESELFGHEKGAFTGAVQRRIGRFELAQGGTIFLDEVGELPLDLQAKLLRVLQEHEIERVGGTRPIAVDVRVISATNRDLASEARAGRFRSDLYYRLAVFPLTIPPLRERREDIPALARALADRLPWRKSLEPDVLQYLASYDWPGNVRELANVLERASVLARGESIGLADLPELAASAPLPPAGPGVATSKGPLRERVQAYERDLIASVLRDTGDNQSETARLLQTSRATLQYRMRVLKLG